MNSIVTIGSLDDVGLKRDHQEDAYGYKQFTKLTERERAKGQLFVVADGVGGQQAGEVASRLAVEAILRQYYAARVDAVESLRQALLAANQEVYAAAYEMGQEKMGTTAVCVVIQGQELIVGHVGDSRAYLWRRDQLQQLTIDHSWVAEQIAAGALTADAVSSHPYRNLITRSLGNKPDVVPEIRSLGGLADGDRIMLCTDGLYDGVSDVKMAAVLKKRSPKDACQELIRLANEAGGTDNITVMVLDIQLDQDNEAATSDQTEILMPYPAEAFSVPSDERECEISWRLQPRMREPYEIREQIALPDGRCITCELRVPGAPAPQSSGSSLQIAVSDGPDQQVIVLLPRGLAGQTDQRHPGQIPAAIVDDGTSLCLFCLGNTRVCVNVTQVEYRSVGARQFKGLTARFRIHVPVATNAAGTVGTD